jgi:hypothetical protein
MFGLTLLVAIVASFCALVEASSAYMSRTLLPDGLYALVAALIAIGLFVFIRHMTKDNPKGMYH